ncbi:preprotein translocase subunit SecF [Pseudoclavibacter chungangensis]|nr:preprotein translocase subunit SecF [Pseudoclavibacter chungangensis]
MAGFLSFGNDLYTGERSVNFVGLRRIWFTVAALAVLLSIAAPFIRGGLELGIEFTGGSEFTVSGAQNTDQAIATDIVARYTSTPARVSTLGDGAVRVQTEPLSEEATSAVRQELATAYGITDIDNVAVSTIGPAWGQDITRQMSIGLVVFIAIAAILMALYFRTWKMSLAALVGLAHDLVVTAGIYALTGVEVTPAAVIGFLTILGYSLYDTVVVFDKIRENTENYTPDGTRTFGELVNLAINQTLVRSINTSVVALLPVAAILFIGAFIMGAGTLRDISLALFIGIFVGALSTIFLAGPMYAMLRSSEPNIKRIDGRILARRRGEKPADDGPIEPLRKKKRSDDDDIDTKRAARASGSETEKPWELDVDDEELIDDPDLDEYDDDEDDEEPVTTASKSSGKRSSSGTKAATRGQRAQPKRRRR